MRWYFDYTQENLKALFLCHLNNPSRFLCKNPTSSTEICPWNAPIKPAALLSAVSYTFNQKLFQILNLKLLANIFETRGLIRHAGELGELTAPRSFPGRYSPATCAEVFLSESLLPKFQRMVLATRFWVGGSQRRWFCSSFTATEI